MIIGYTNIKTGALRCVLCAHAEEWDFEAELIEAITEDDLRATIPCPRCEQPLKQANVLVRCSECGHLRTRGGM